MRCTNGWSICRKYSRSRPTLASESGAIGEFSGSRITVTIAVEPPAASPELPGSAASLGRVDLQTWKDFSTAPRVPICATATGAPRRGSSERSIMPRSSSCASSKHWRPRSSPESMANRVRSRVRSSPSRCAASASASSWKQRSQTRSR